MELERSMDDDFGDRLAACYDRLSRESVQPSLGTIPPEADETIDDDLQSCLECLSLIDRVRHRQELSSLLSSRATFAQANRLNLPRSLGHFRIERELGRGGAGIVLLATDIQLGRKVAVKVPHPQFLLNEELRRRFALEAGATARFDHPHIVRVYEVGQEGPISFIATEYCDGPTLHGWQAACRERIAPRVAATIVRDLAEAVQHAHSQSVVHRDIKPSNILVVGTKTEHGEAIPVVKLCDFGLAKLLDEDGEHTRTGDLLGTPAYMAPEQAEGKLREIDTRTDVYALGALLFELLSGRPPFEGETRSAILLRVIQDEPLDVRSFRKDAPIDLAVIIAKSLSKSKKERYASAQELADELSRHLKGEPIHARPSHWWERLFKWARRRPAAAAAALLGLALPVTVLAISLWANAALYEKNREIMSRLYVADMRAAKQAIDDNRMIEAKEILSKYKPSFGTPDVRSLAWRLLASQVDAKDIVEWKCHEGDIYSLDVSPDRTLLATASQDGTACLWDYATGKLVHRLSGHDGDVNEVFFSPDGSLLATCGNDGTVRIWDAATGDCRFVIQAHTDEVGGLAFHPSGEQLTSSSRDGSVRTWSVLDGTAVGEAMHFDHQLGAIAYAEDGQFLLVTTEEPSLRAIRTASQETAWVLNKDNDVAAKIRTVAVAEGAPILMGSWDGRIHEIDSEGEIQHLTAAGTSGVASIQVSPDRSRYVLARENGDLELCQFQWNDSITPVYASRSRIWDVHFANSGDQVLIASTDGFVRHVPLPELRNRGLRTIAFLDDDVHGIVPSADGRLLFAASESTLAIIDAVQGRCVKKRGEFPSRVFDLALSLDERYLATCEESGRVCVWDASTLECLKERTGFRSEVQTATAEAVVFTANVETLLVGHGDTLAQWNWAKDEVVWRADIGFGQIIDIARLSDGRVLLGCSDGLVGLRPNTAGFEEYFRRETLSDNYRICTMRGSPNAYVGERDGSIQRILVDSGSKEFRDTVTPKRAIEAMAIDPTGQWLGLGGKGGELCLVDAVHFSVKSTTVLEGKKIRATAFSPNGETLYAGLSDGSILAKFTRAMEGDTFLDPSSEMLFLCTSPNGDFIAIHDRHPSIKLFDSSPLQRRPSWMAREFHRASFSPDGTELILAAENRIYRARIDALDDEPEHILTVTSKIKELFHIANDCVLYQDESDSLRTVRLNAQGSEAVLWDARNGKKERWAVSPDGRTLAIGTVDGEIHLLDLETEKRSSVEVRGRIRALAFTPDGVRLAVGTEHGEIHFLNTSTRQWGSILQYPENAAVRDIAFADDGRTMLTTSAKEGIQLWNMATGEVVFELDTDFQVASLAYVPSTDRIIACGQDADNRGVLRIHRATPSR